MARAGCVSAARRRQGSCSDGASLSVSLPNIRILQRIIFTTRSIRPSSLPSHVSVLRKSHGPAVLLLQKVHGSNMIARCIGDIVIPRLCMIKKNQLGAKSMRFPVMSLLSSELSATTGTIPALFFSATPSEAQIPQLFLLLFGEACRLHQSAEKVRVADADLKLLKAC